MSKTIVLILNFAVGILGLLIVSIQYVKDTAPKPDVKFFATRVLIITAAMGMQNRDAQAHAYRKKALEVLSGIERRGLHLSPEDR